MAAATRGEQPSNATPASSVSSKAGVKQAPAAPVKIKFEHGSSVEEKKGAPTKPCAGHLGAQMGATREDGRAYACSFGKDCIFRHVSIAGKSDQKLLDLIGGLPVAAQADLKKSITAKN